MIEDLWTRLNQAWRPSGSRWDASWRDDLRRLALPYKLPAVAGRSSPQFPHHAEMIAAFSGQGYGGGRSKLQMSKRTANHNRLLIEIDVGTWSHAAHCNLVIGWAAWKKRDLPSRTTEEILSCISSLKGCGTLKLPVWFCADQDLNENGGYGSYPIVSRQAWNQMMQNAAVVVAHLEKEYVPGAETALAALLDVPSTKTSVKRKR
jgi:hypothetical protein